MKGETSHLYKILIRKRIRMLVVISPAKKLDENCDKNIINKFTVPPYLENSKKIVKALRSYSINSLSKLMCQKRPTKRICDWKLAAWKKESVLCGKPDPIVAPMFC